MPIDPNFWTLRRRARELLRAAITIADEDSKTLLQFYGVECGLKALYLDAHKLQTTAVEGANARSARWFGHRIDDLIVALRIAAHRALPRPTTLTLRNGTQISVAELHEAWRYGEKLQDPASVAAWMNALSQYVREELA